MKQIPHYPGYFAKDDGTIHSSLRGGLHQLKPHYRKRGGYGMVILRRNGLSEGHYVHRLVAVTYMENPENLPEVNHKSFNKKDNSVNNLEWATKSDNYEHFKKHYINTVPIGVIIE